MQFLIIQTAFIGDVILATGLPEKIKRFYPDARVDFLVRKGNESLLDNNPFIDNVIIWNKQSSKYRNLFRLWRKVRKQGYSHVINLQRFAAMGFVTSFSKAQHKAGFDKNPFSWGFNKKVNHVVGDGNHEVDRNNQLIAELTDETRPYPKLYPSESDRQKIQEYQGDFVVLAPSSVWFTKQTPQNKWVELVDANSKTTFYLIGSNSDKEASDDIIKSSKNPNVVNLCGKMTLLESAALIEKAQMTFTNDSAPMHLASAMNAPVNAVYCSTIPEFGFGPLSEKSAAIQTMESLSCRPCGLHGFKKCPEGHFKCATTINLSKSIAEF